MCALVVCVVVNVVLYPAVMQHPAPVATLSKVQVSVMEWWKLSVLPFSVVVEEAWNGKCSRYEVCLYSLL